MPLPQTEIIAAEAGVEILRKTLTPGEYVVGRDPGCDLRVDVEGVSRRHARLTVALEHVVIEDLGSSNGTYVSGRAITEPTRLWPNQKIQIGRAVLELRRLRTGAGTDDTLAPHTVAIRKALPPESLHDRKYAIGGVVARGGMGAILDAREAPTGRTVAMKVMLKTGSSDEVMRFITEAKVTARLEHPNIVPVHELSVDENDHVFYTMKFVRGVTLRAVLEALADNSPATIAKHPLAVLLTIFQKVCDALAFAHSRGVVHRDLKPSNVMLGDYGEVLVMDWGLSKVDAANPDIESVDAIDLTTLGTLEGRVMGTPQYMSPEQARGEVDQLDARTDIYALGGILYHMLVLCPPVAGANVRELVYKAGAGAVTPLLEARAAARVRRPHLPGQRVPESLIAVARKAMAFEREARYAKVEDLQADISAYQNGFATGAENAGAGKQVMLLIKRHKGVSVAMAAGLALLGGVSVAFTVRLLREKNVAVGARVLAETERQRAEQALGTTEAQRRRAEQALAAADAERRRAETERQRAEQALGVAEGERSRAQTALATADTQRQRAEQALGELKKTAPTFSAQAQSLLEQGQIEAAVENIGYAIRLDDGNADYHLLRANLLEALQRLTEAAEEYRRVLALRPGDEAAETNLALCERLLAANGRAPALREDLQKQLLVALREQNRLIEAGPLSALLEPDRAIAEANLLARLRGYRAQPGWDKSRWSRLPDGTFSVTLDNLALGELSVLGGQPISALSFGYTDISDLRGLRGLPLTRLVLSYSKVSDLAPLRGMPLESLALIGLPVTDLAPLAGMKLRYLALGRTQVTDLSPLAGMPLEYLSANNTWIADLAPLRGVPLTYLNISASHVTELAPLAGAPLATLDISYNQIVDLQPLAECPRLETLLLSQTLVADLAPLAKLHLKELDFSHTCVGDLAPLRSMPLRKIRLDGTSVADFTPLAECRTLEEIVVPADARNVEPLRKLLRLRSISTGAPDERPGQTAKEFWKAYDAEREAGRR